MMNRTKTSFVLTAVILLGVLCALQYVGAEMAIPSSSVDPNSSDAIAVRIVPNPNHYNIARWYESQGFQGSPQALLVDGYEAIRDGRTVYVNAANIDQDSNTIYTNIYLISYNQESTSKTVDILGQIVSHWKFNNNVVETSSPTCAISSLGCAIETDCPQNAKCANSGISSSSCVLKTVKNCLVDADCPTNFFCNSLKSRISRDLKRIGRLEEIKEALFNFKKSKGYYPKLESGTYLSGNSISVWPSWSQTFLSSLALPQSSLDYINRLGACSGYNVKTCWNADSKTFFDNQSATNTYLVLPPGSYAFAYATDKNGSAYNLCAVLESRSTSTSPSYHFSSDDPNDSNCALAGIATGGQAANSPPYLVSQSLVGDAGQVFNGYIKVSDPENNPLIWTLGTSGTVWTGWSAAPVLQNTSNSYQKKIYALKAGNPGTYNITLNVNDGQGGVLATTTAIKILSSAVSVEADDAEYLVDPVNPLTYSFFFSGNDVATNSYSLAKIAGSFDLLGTLKQLNKTVTAVSSNKYRVDYSGLISETNKFYQDANFKYNVKITDGQGNAADKNFTIKVKTENPLLDFNCPSLGRINMSYSCVLGPNTQGNHSLIYSGTGFPSGISLTSFGNDLGLQGLPNFAETKNIVIKAVNEYGASSTKTFSLKINNYCGDGTKQSPNTEERGGLYNDGYEDCDITAGVATSVSTSSALQYGCQTTATSIKPFPILTNDQCVFKSPTQGGGYCGDTYCQTTYENKTNCQQDCGSGAVISGAVTNSATQAVLSGVTLKITKSDGTEVANSTTGPYGTYAINLLPVTDTYTITASMSGFQDSSQNFTADDNKAIDLTLSPLPSIVVSGKVIDYMSGNGLNGVNLKIFKKIDNTELANGTTNSSGVYSISLNPVSGQYTIIASLDHYKDGIKDFETSETINFSLTADNLDSVARASLEWGAATSSPDLDFHLLFGSALSPIHISYENKCDVLIGFCSNDSDGECRVNSDCNFGHCSDAHNICFNSSDCDSISKDSCVNFESGTCKTNIYSLCDTVNSTVTLDRDDQNDGSEFDLNGPSVGLENMRIVSFKSGATYKYYIKDFSHHPQSNCKFNGATVKVYNGGGVLVKTYVASNQVGSCYWYVFDMNDTGQITDRNVYSNNAPQ